MLTFLIFISLFLSYQSTDTLAADAEGVLDKIKNGLQTAKNYLETAKEIADLVSTSLGHNKYQRRGDDGGKKDSVTKRLGPGNFTSAFFRLLGLDTSRIAAIAVNTAIFVTQMIASLFNIQSKSEEKKPEGREAPDSPKFDPLQFLINSKNEKIQRLLNQAKNPELPKRLIENLNSLDTPCIQLLMCKVSPIILAAQESINNKTVNRKFDLTSWLPDRDTFEGNSDACDEQYLACRVFPEQ